MARVHSEERRLGGGSDASARGAGRIAAGKESRAKRGDRPSGKQADRVWRGRCYTPPGLPPALLNASAWEPPGRSSSMSPRLRACWPRVLEQVQRIELPPPRSYAQCTQGGGLFTYTLADAFASLVEGPVVAKALPDVLAGTSGGAWWTANQQRHTAARLVPRVMAFLSALPRLGNVAAARAGVSVLRNGIEAQKLAEGDCNSDAAADRRQCDAWRSAFINTALGFRWNRDDLSTCNFNLLKFGRWVTSAYGQDKQYRRPSCRGGTCPVLSSSSVYTQLLGDGTDLLYEDLLLIYASQGGASGKDNTCAGYKVPGPVSSSAIAVSFSILPPPHGSTAEVGARVGLSSALPTHIEFPLPTDLPHVLPPPDAASAETTAGPTTSVVAGLATLPNTEVALLSSALAPGALVSNADELVAGQVEEGMYARMSRTSAILNTVPYNTEDIKLDDSNTWVSDVLLRDSHVYADEVQKVRNLYANAGGHPYLSMADGGAADPSGLFAAVSYALQDATSPTPCQISLSSVFVPSASGGEFALFSAFRDTSGASVGTIVPIFQDLEPLPHSSSPQTWRQEVLDWFSQGLGNPGIVKENQTMRKRFKGGAALQAWRFPPLPIPTQNPLTQCLRLVACKIQGAREIQTERPFTLIAWGIAVDNASFQALPPAGAVELEALSSNFLDSVQYSDSAAVRHRAPGVDSFLSLLRKEY